MKGYLWILCGIFLFYSSQVKAQKGQELIAGAGAAITSSWILNQNSYGEAKVDYAPKMGYAGSLNLGYSFTEKISCIMELQLSVQGQKYEGKQVVDEISYTAKRNIDLRYFNVPVLFKYAVGNGNTRFRFMVGPQLGILLEATQDYKRDGQKLSYGSIIDKPKNLNGKTFVPDANDITRRYEKYDVSFVLDLGADFHISDKVFINSGLRLNYGLKDINASAYRIEDLNGEYDPSYNVWGGIYVGINYKIDVEAYSQRSY